MGPQPLQVAEEGVAAGVVTAVDAALQRCGGLPSAGLHRAAKPSLWLAPTCPEPTEGKLEEALCPGHQIHLGKRDDQEIGEPVASAGLMERENPVKWLAAVVWWLRTVAESQAKGVREEYFKCKK
ncbi:small ribosomal subunit protein eS12-like [Castor canadensis]|jgi:hypothetical protein|uniref:Small ribosomal subunit protein eS12-like n=1 Tax=Castor canadensis TaxID=51338 RepID=A0AC58LCW6_CASCN